MDPKVIKDFNQLLGDTRRYITWPRMYPRVTKGPFVCQGRGFPVVMSEQDIPNPSYIEVDLLHNYVSAAEHLKSLCIQYITHSNAIM